LENAYNSQMDSYDEQATELAKAAVKEIFAPVQDLFQKLLGPAANEVGLSLADSARVWRLRRAIRLLEQVKAMVTAAGIEVQPVAPRLVFPIIEAASLEDDDDLHHRWAALLTNAANGNGEADVIPAFPRVLSEITPSEANFLDGAYDQVIADEEAQRAKIRHEHPGLTNEPWVISAVRRESLGPVNEVMLGNPERLGLINWVSKSTIPRQKEFIYTVNPPDQIYISSFGRAFVRACRPPVGRNQQSKTQLH
jgi:hypothetical protein